MARPRPPKLLCNFGEAGPPLVKPEAAAEMARPYHPSPEAVDGGSATLMSVLPCGRALHHNVCFALKKVAGPYLLTLRRTLAGVISQGRYEPK